VDSADAVVPEGTATIRSLETGVERATQNLSSGGFSFELLPIGNYQVRVEARGFRSGIADVEVKAGETGSLRMQLQVGATTETITVTDALTLLDTESSQMQYSFTGPRVQQIPVGRNPNLLALTGPGIAPVTSNSTFGSGSFNANGQRGRANNVTVDGITSTDVSVTGTGGTLGPLNFETIKEAKFITNNFSAEYGRNSGSQVLYLTKSGTNRIRGTAYEYLRNNVLNARPFFDTTGKANIVKRNEYGVEVGGPFRIPGYDGRDRTFWHADWEQQKQRGAGAPVIANVPTPQMLAQVTDPTSLALIKQYQLPSSPRGQLDFSGSNVSDSTLWSGRVDHNFSTTDVVWFRYARSNSASFSSGNTFVFSNFPYYGLSSGGPVHQATAGYTHTFTPSLVNEFRFGFGKSNAQFNIETPYPLGPRIQFSDASVDRFGVWEGAPQGRKQRTMQFSDNLSYVRGSHSFKMGGEWFRLDTNNDLASFTRGLYTFANWNDFAIGAPTGVTQRFGETLRRHRTNNIFGFAQDDWKVNRNLTLNLGVRMEYAGGPVEKDGRVSVLDFSDRSSFGAAGAGAFGNYVLGKPIFNSNTNWAPRVGFAWTSNDRKTVVRSGYGIAYDFVYMNPITNGRSLPPLITTATVAGTANFTGGNSWARWVAGTSDLQVLTKSQVGVLSTTALNFGAASPIVNPDLRNPQTHTWNFGLEREIMGTVFKATYVGNKSNYLQRSRDLNFVANPARPAANVADETARLAEFTTIFGALNGNASRRSNRFDPRFNAVVFFDNSAQSNYNALQLEAGRQIGGLDLRANWTWAKSLDNGSDGLASLVGDSANAQNPLNFRDNYGASQFDLRHRVVITYAWELPWLKKANNGLTRHALGGWSVAGVTSFRTGFPVTLDAGARRGITVIPNIGGGGAVRPNLTGPVTVDWRPSGSAGSPTGLNSDPVQRISTYAASLGLSQPLLGNFGQMGRNVLRLNGERNFDFNVYKTFRLQENTKLELRGEFYNLFNNTSFGDVNRNITNTSFGQYTSVAQDARFVQVAARLIF
jgi:hypothetical protein